MPSVDGEGVNVIHRKQKYAIREHADELALT